MSDAREHQEDLQEIDWKGLHLTLKILEDRAAAGIPLWIPCPEVHPRDIGIFRVEMRNAIMRRVDHVLSTAQLYEPEEPDA